MKMPFARGPFPLNIGPRGPGRPPGTKSKPKVTSKAFWGSGAGEKRANKLQKRLEKLYTIINKRAGETAAQSKKRGHIPLPVLKHRFTKLGGKIQAIKKLT